MINYRKISHSLFQSTEIIINDITNINEITHY